MAYHDPETGRARDRERFARRTAERRAAGLCPRCGQAPAAPERTVCEDCGEKRREADRARYAAGKAAGKLYGGRDPDAKRQHDRRDAGLCTRCGRLPPVEGGTTCELCRMARRPSARSTLPA